MEIRHACEELADGKPEKAKELIRNFRRQERTGRLAAYAHKSDKAKNASWVFADRPGGTRTFG